MSRRELYIAGLSALIVGVVIVAFGITTRKIADAKLQEWTENQAVPVVAVAAPDLRGKTTTFSLPGRLEAYTQARICPRQRLREGLAGRHRRARQNRRPSR